jgi:YD repeat-containing protein
MTYIAKYFSIPLLEMDNSPHYNYHSEEIVSHYTANNGRSKGNTRRNVVDVHNNAGTKSVNTYDASGKLVHQASKPLNEVEIQNIKSRIFMPGLFKDVNKDNKTSAIKTMRKNRRKTRKAHK